MSEQTDQMQPDLSERRGHPQAVLYRNEDGVTASGRFPQNPYIEHILMIADKDRGILELTIEHYLTGEVLEEFTFDLAATVSDRWLAGDGGSHDVFPALEDTSMVLVDIGWDSARWAVQRRINPETDRGGLI